MVPLLASFLSLLSILAGVFASVVRVETGHQNIEIAGRDGYMGFFTRVRFHEVTCVQSLTVHCLKPLTGAEEVDLLLSECARGNWKVAHYTNTKEEFRLKQPFLARQMLIASRQPLTIIDVQVRACSNQPQNISSVPHCLLDHALRHGKSGPIHASDSLRRTKREVDYPEEVIEAHEQLDFSEDKIVPSGHRLIVQQGVQLRFSPETSLVVHGSLLINGTKDSPVIITSTDGQWKGIKIEKDSTASYLNHVNISQASIGLSVSPKAPVTIQNTIVDGNDVGMQIDTDQSSMIMRRSIAVNNRRMGIHLLGKVSSSRSNS